MPIINRGDDYFQALTYTGNGSTQTITGLRFQPDFVWIKGRSGATDHALYDVVRGVQKDLVSNSTAAETTQSTGVTAFTSDGFTVGSLAKVNTNGATYVYWAWKANGAGVTNTAGTITSTVSANTTAGFSIVTYTGTGSAPQSIGHGLGVTPSMIILKRRDTTSDWYVNHTSIGTNDLRLNTTDSSAANGIFSAKSSTTFTINSTIVQSGNWVAYVFAEVAGYSKFGSYIGNGSADGPFVFCGFRPRYVLIKASGLAESWYVYDSARNTYNVVDLELNPNNSGAEATFTTLDFVSNGFKIRNTNSAFNTSSATYIYAAFAENPFKYSLAR